MIICFIYHSVKLVRTAAKKPKALKLSSNELHSARPSTIGIRLRFVRNPVTSPIKMCEIITVKIGEDDFTVSTNEIAACFNAIKPRTIEKSLLKKNN